ncbi:MAG: hypothetical protein KDB03_13775 [Planctomycetales bacterium]|nr:hypothetical protein [Planctomycetales bacterium]
MQAENLASLLNRLGDPPWQLFADWVLQLQGLSSTPHFERGEKTAGEIGNEGSEPDLQVTLEKIALGNDGWLEIAPQYQGKNCDLRPAALTLIQFLEGFSVVREKQLKHSMFGPTFSAEPLPVWTDLISRLQNVAQKHDQSSHASCNGSLRPQSGLQSKHSRKRQQRRRNKAGRYWRSICILGTIAILVIIGSIWLPGKMPEKSVLDRPELGNHPQVGQTEKSESSLVLALDSIQDGQTLPPSILNAPSVRETQISSPQTNALESLHEPRQRPVELSSPDIPIDLANVSGTNLDVPHYSAEFVLPSDIGSPLDLLENLAVGTEDRADSVQSDESHLLVDLSRVQYMQEHDVGKHRFKSLTWCLKLSELKDDMLMVVPSQSQWLSSQSIVSWRLQDSRQKNRPEVFVDVHCQMASAKTPKLKWTVYAGCDEFPNLRIPLNTDWLQASLSRVREFSLRCKIEAEKLSSLAKLEGLPSDQKSQLHSNSKYIESQGRISDQILVVLQSVLELQSKLGSRLQFSAAMFDDYQREETGVVDSAKNVAVLQFGQLP